jgi:hypothetical protein
VACVVSHFWNGVKPRAWHDVARITQEESLQRTRDGHVHDWQTGSQVAVSPVSPGVAPYGSGKSMRTIDTGVRSGKKGVKRAWFLLSYRPAQYTRVTQDGWRMRMESPFQDLKRRGWQWESSHVRHVDRLDRLVLIVFLPL